MTTEIFVANAKKVHGNKYCYNNTVYNGMKVKVTIRCSSHGDFDQFPSNHLKHGCRKCSAQLQSQNKTQSKARWVEKFNKLHGNRYQYHYDISPRSLFRITCGVHGDFKRTRDSHLKGRGCPYCAGTAKETTQSFALKFIKLHGHKYDTSKMVYVSSRVKITIGCNTHGYFEKYPYYALNTKSNSLCQKCIQQNKKMTFEQFESKAQLLHNKRYKYYQDDWQGLSTNTNILCLSHGTFVQLPGNHLAKHGCPLCNAGALRTFSESVQLCNDKFGDRYKYASTCYTDNSSLIEVTCNTCRGVFSRSMGSLLSGKGNCPGCSPSRKSVSERAWLYSINVNDMIFEHKIAVPELYSDSQLRQNKSIFVDGYDPLTNTVYEFHGDYWHGNPDVYNSLDTNSNNKKAFGVLYLETQAKEKLIKFMGYNLVVMWENDWKNRFDKSI